MTRLAIDGGPKAVSQPLRPFRTIGEAEIDMVAASMRAGPLSGYLGGELRGGLRVEALEHEFAGILGVKHAVAFNSATSGLLGACVACGVGHRSKVVTTPYTMSATAAAPAFLGADIFWGDIEAKTFSLATVGQGHAVIITNLFGHPANLAETKKYCEGEKLYMIEDNAQAPFAMEGTKYAGTVGDIGVFSFNVHKHLQCGEGGIAVTQSDSLAHGLRMFRNHAELDINGPARLGLNLRMTEPTAAIALAQLKRRDSIIAGRIELAEELTHMVAPYDNNLQLPTVREGCKHVYYCWPILFISPQMRDWFVRAINAEGVPMRAGYVTPLYNLPAFAAHWIWDGKRPVTEDVESRIALFEVCAYDPSKEVRKQMKEAFTKVCDLVFSKKEVA